MALERCRATLQSVSPGRGGSSPRQPPPHLPPASDTLWRVAPSCRAGDVPFADSLCPAVLLSLLPRPCTIPAFSLAPSLCPAVLLSLLPRPRAIPASVTFLVDCCSGLASAMVYVTPALPSKASSSGPSIASLVSLPFLLTGDLFSSGLVLSRCEMDTTFTLPSSTWPWPLPCRIRGWRLRPLRSSP